MVLAGMRFKGRFIGVSVDDLSQEERSAVHNTINVLERMLDVRTRREYLQLYMTGCGALIFMIIGWVIAKASGQGVIAAALTMMCLTVGGSLFGYWISSLYLRGWESDYQEAYVRPLSEFIQKSDRARQFLYDASFESPRVNNLLEEYGFKTRINVYA